MVPRARRGTLWVRPERRSRVDTDGDTRVVSQKLVSTPSFAPRFDDWFRFRFPENNLSSAPSAHKALWAEHERQLRWTSEERTKAGAVEFVTPEPDDGGGGYLSRLRKNSQNPAAKRVLSRSPRRS